MRKSEEFSNRLLAIRNEVVAKIKELLKERNITSLNVYTYWVDAGCTRYIYYDVDDDGMASPCMSIRSDSTEITCGSK